MTAADAQRRVLDLIAAGRRDEAADLLDRRLRQHPDDFDACQLLGIVRLGQRRLEDGLLWLGRAQALRPSDPGIHNNLGNAWCNARSWDDAIASYREALRWAPDHVDALESLGGLLTARGRPEEAEPILRRALTQAPQRPSLHHTLGRCLQESGQLDEAIATYRTGLTLHPSDAALWNNLASALNARGESAESLACSARSLSLAPDYEEARWNRALALLKAGEWTEGWRLYEVRTSPRLARRPTVPPPLPCPGWSGGPLTGKALLLVGEQGFGDQIQFLRFAAPLARRGARVTAVVSAELTALARSAPGVSAAVEADLRLGESNDHWVMMMSVPHLLPLTLGDLPGPIPYLKAPADAVADWSLRLNSAAGASLKVGLAWAGSPTHQADRHRSLDPSHLKVLLGIPGVQFFSLQKGKAADAIGSQGEAASVVRLGSDLRDFNQTAAVIVNLDLVIAVDTAVAHLAGALGRPVWTLLPWAADWRWMSKGDDSPWYPTMRLFRQSQARDWNPLLETVGSELRQLLAKRRNAGPLEMPPMG